MICVSLPWSRTDLGSWRTPHVPRPNVWTDHGRLSFWEFSVALDPSVRRRMAPSLFPASLRARLWKSFRPHRSREPGSGGGHGVEDDGFLPAGRLQSRYGSVVLDEDHLMAAPRYVALKSGAGKAGFPGAGLALVQRPRASGPTRQRTRQRRAATRQMQRRNSSTSSRTQPAANEAMAALRGAETIGRPLGSPAFLERLATLTGRDPRPSKRGPKPAANRGFSKVSP